MRAKEAGVRVGWGFKREWGTKRRVSEVGEGVAPDIGAVVGRKVVRAGKGSLGKGKGVGRK